MDGINQNRMRMQCPPFKFETISADEQKGLLPPSYQIERTKAFITLPPFANLISGQSYMELLDNRRSERVYTQTSIAAEQLAFLLWSASGIQYYRGRTKNFTFRPVPSAGARHPFEIYAAIRKVDGLEPGLYHYTPTKHVGEKRVTIEYLGPFDNYEARMTEMLMGQKWATKASVVLFVSCIPYRAEWRYSEGAYRMMLIDLGHIGQNLMLSATALGLGSCPLAAYDQKLCDETFSFNGIDEYTVYAVSVGNLKTKSIE